jgi:quercetin dioxygenase-like cupin family protein
MPWIDRPLAPGGAIAPHRATGPITVHVVAGDIDFRVGERTHRLEAGDLLALGAGVEHAVSSRGGGRFVLTVVEQAGDAP